jgi:hypothetical protein
VAWPTAYHPEGVGIDCYGLMQALEENGFALCAMAHLTTSPASWRGGRLIDDETVAKMEHANLDVGHPAIRI